MKGTLKTLIAIGATPLLLASCSDEAAPGPIGEGQNLVTITAQLPEGTRASFADGTTAQTLHYAVYEKGATTPLGVFEGGATEASTTINLSTTVKLQLASGRTYDVVFFADAATGSPYTFNATGQTVDVDYATGATPANDERRDAFYNKVEIAVAGNMQQTVTLTRPFAQLNIGTDDIAAATAAGFTPAKTEVRATVGNKLNLADGTIEGEAEQTFELAAIPQGETFPVAGYDYLSMNYLLVPATKTVGDVKLTVADATGAQAIARTYTNVPVQRNYRTNIYGSLLTNTVDFNVEIVPDFLGSFDVVTTDQQLAAAVTEPNSYVKVADNAQLMLPTTIAEGVVITGGTNSMLKVKNGYEMPNDKVTLQNITIARDDSFGDNDGCYFKVNADDVVLDNVKFGIINPTADSYVGGGIYVNSGKTLTVKNTDISLRAAYALFAMDANTTFVLENCEIGLNTQFATNQPGNGKIVAKNTTFHGWMSGWSDGYFENCKFEWGNLYYPYARCYGSTTFKNCTFQKLSTDTDNRWLPTAPDRSDFQYDYAVSCMKQHSVIEFTGCRYSNGAAFDKNVFLKGTQDSSGDPDKVIVDGTVYTDMSEFIYW